MPHPARCRCAHCINQQLDAASGRDRDRVARKIVKRHSVADLRCLSPETRRRLQEVLGDGHVSDADRRAIEKIQASDLAEVEYQPRLIIKGPPDFVAETASHLDSISQTRTGRRLLQSLSRSGRTVTIVPSARANEAPPVHYPGAFAAGTTLRFRGPTGRLRSIRGTGAGSDTMIRYNPDRTAWRSAGDRPPPALALAHELIHADDAAYGRMDPEEQDGLRNFERQAIGLPPYEDKEFTENRLRSEWAQPPRRRH